jgi:hypothetical protein
MHRVAVGKWDCGVKEKEMSFPRVVTCHNCGEDMTEEYSRADCKMEICAKCLHKQLNLQKDRSKQIAWACAMDDGIISAGHAPEGDVKKVLSELIWRVSSIIGTEATERLIKELEQ